MAKHAKHSQPKQGWFSKNPRRQQGASGGVSAPQSKPANLRYPTSETTKSEPTKPQNIPVGAAMDNTPRKAETRRPDLSRIPQVAGGENRTAVARQTCASQPRSYEGARPQDAASRHPSQTDAPSRSRMPQHPQERAGISDRAPQRPARMSIPSIEPDAQQPAPNGNLEAQRFRPPANQAPANASAQRNPAVTGSVPVYSIPAYGAPAYVQYAPNGAPVYVHYVPNPTPMYIPYQPDGNPAVGAYPHPRRQAPAKQKKKRHPGCLVPIIAIPIALLALVALLVITRPGFAQPLIEGAFGIQETHPAVANDSGIAFEDVSDVPMTDDAQVANQNKQAHTCRLLAQCQGVDIYSPIAQDELTGIVMHQASYEWGQVMTTQAPQADMAEYEASGNPLRVNNEQTEGTWVDADIAHLYRDTDTTEMDTAADVGGEAGTTVFAPVTGEVIAVENYDLYDETPDVRIHIRPDANPNLDVVLLHQTDPTVTPGDRVEAGITPISSVRDIAAELTDIQLAYYTKTAGNHSHVQVNNLTNPDYIAKYNLQVS